MCLILFALDEHPRYPLIIAANRDEAHHRPSAALAFWTDAPHIAGGRDLDAGGTWLGIARDGRWAALTNYRQAGSYRQGAPSRGHLVSEYLLTKVEPEAYIESLRPRAANYNGFSLLLGRVTDVYCFSNRTEHYQKVARGSHGLSNHLLDTPWPKVTNGKKVLDTLPDLPAPAVTEILLCALRDHALPSDSELPDTGVGVPGERVLSPTFIVAERYGTRASTVVLVDTSGAVSIVERAFGPMGRPLGSTSLDFVFDAAAPTVAPAG